MYTFHTHITIHGFQPLWAVKFQAINLNVMSYWCQTSSLRM